MQNLQPSKQIIESVLLKMFLAVVILTACIPTVSARTSKCSVIRGPSNGRKHGFDYSVGQTVSYECNEGYKLIGSTTRTCQRNLQWTGAQPTCQEISCSPPENPEHGKVSITGEPLLGNVVIFECLGDYKLDGLDISVCQMDGRWSSKLPICRKACKFPLQPGKGWQRGGYEHGAVGILGCYGDYIIDGVRQSRCNDGQWFPPLTSHVCRAPCAIASPPTEGLIIEGDDYRHGYTVWFYCETGYVLRGVDSALCQDGKWFHPIPECVQITYGYSKITYSMNFFRTKSFSKLLGDRIVKLQNKHRVFVQITAENIPVNTSLLIKSCVATPSADPRHSITYTMIKKGCFLDPTLQKHEQPSPSTLRFSFQSFRFVRHGQKVFLHCSLRACLAGSLQDDCTVDDCQSNGVRRRRHADHIASGISFQVDASYLWKFIYLKGGE